AFVKLLPGFCARSSGALAVDRISARHLHGSPIRCHTRESVSRCHPIAAPRPFFVRFSSAPSGAKLAAVVAARSTSAADVPPTQREFRCSGPSLLARNQGVAPFGLRWHSL